MKNQQSQFLIQLLCLFLILMVPILVTSTGKQVTTGSKAYEQQTPTSPIPAISKTPCRPKPACLSARPACKIAEPVTGWCQPQPSPVLPRGCYYRQVECIKAPCDPIMVCPKVTAKPLLKTSVAPGKN